MTKTTSAAAPPTGRKAAPAEDAVRITVGNKAKREQ